MKIFKLAFAAASFEVIALVWTVTPSEAVCYQTITTGFECSGIHKGNSVDFGGDSA